MAYQVNVEVFNSILKSLSEHYRIMAPRVYVGAGSYSDTNRIEYGEVTRFEEIEMDEKSEFSFKEVLFPQTEVLFYFTENETKVSDGSEKGRIIFLRSCDLHSVKRFDEIYLKNGFADSYYERLRTNTYFFLIGCPNSFENCFCVSMGTNISDNYNAYVKADGDTVCVDSQWDILTDLLDEKQHKEMALKIDYVTRNEVKVTLTKAEGAMLNDVLSLPLWEDYKSRCISCGRCNFVCPTCTCFTMQDIFYKENGRVGERRRVWASCHVDGYTDMAGGLSFRKNERERMRFKVMHKINDFKRRFGYHMCVGCGRCDDICPEYISFSNCINKLDTALTEKGENEDE